MVEVKLVVACIISSCVGSFLTAFAWVYWRAEKFNREGLAK